ncbi:MAG: hypothetical protein LBP62_03530 [Clostridiales bacterium]|nr:hypothetical protein [Clostridiales bacterium]
MKKKKFKAEPFFSLMTGYFFGIILGFFVFSGLIWMDIHGKIDGTVAERIILYIILFIAICFLIYETKPLYYLFTQFYIGEKEIDITQFNKIYTYLFKDIKEIGILPYYTRKKKVIPYVIISKIEGITDKITRVNSYLYGSIKISADYFILSRNNFDNVKKLLSYYIQGHSIINFDIYESALSEKEKAFFKLDNKQ